MCHFWSCRFLTARCTLPIITSENGLKLITNSVIIVDVEYQSGRKFWKILEKSRKIVWNSDLFAYENVSSKLCASIGLSESFSLRLNRKKHIDFKSRNFTIYVSYNHMNERDEYCKKKRNKEKIALNVFFFHVYMLKRHCLFGGLFIEQ